MKFEVKLIINFDETSNKFKIESSNLSIISMTSSQKGPLATLEDNRISFNKEALDVLQVKEGDRINITYVILSDGLLHPIITPGEGNKITKSGTVSCRGASNEVLQKYGKEFILEIIDDKFVLTNFDFKKIVKEEDPNIELPSIEEEIDMGPSSVDDILSELDEPAPKYKDFFDTDGVETELKDIDFESLIE